MKILNRDDLLKQPDLKIEKIHLGDDEHVFVREMTGHERDCFELSTTRERLDEKGQFIDYTKDLHDIRSKLAVCTLCNEKGELFFKFEEYKLLSKKLPAKKLIIIADVAAKLNGLDERNMEKLVKNSESGQNDNFISNSVKN